MSCNVVMLMALGGVDNGVRLVVVVSVDGPPKEKSVQVLDL